MPALRRNPLPLIVKLQGGLGNQLFQITFGVDASRRHGRSVWFDTSFFDGDQGGTPRNLEVNLAPLHLRTTRTIPVLRRMLSLMPAPIRLVETQGNLLQAADVRPATVWVIGHFQSSESPRRVEDVVQTLLRSHCPITPLLPRHVAVHIRLGDYITNPVANAFHGASDPRWSLLQARDLMRQVGVSQIRIFTDSVDRLTQMLGDEIRANEVVDRASNAWEVLSRMRQADGLVISNSSLSWWAAFIATRVDFRKIPVVMPRPWIAEPSIADSALADPRWIIRDRTLWRES